MRLQCWQQGDTELAEAMAREGTACKHAVQDQNGLQAVLETLAWMTAGRGAHERAAMLLGCAEQVRPANGIPFQELYQRQQHDESVALTTRALAQDAFDAAYERGLAMPVDNALGVAPTGEQQPPKPQPAGRGTASLLTRREQEIAGLIADELTTREIAARLFVSERTVEAHVTHMFNKLGVNSRAHLTRWLASVERGGSAEPGENSYLGGNASTQSPGRPPAGPPDIGGTGMSRTWSSEPGIQPASCRCAPDTGSGAVRA